jgi:hypothetical protein
MGENSWCYSLKDFPRSGANLLLSFGVGVWNRGGVSLTDERQRPEAAGQKVSGRENLPGRQRAKEKAMFDAHTIEGSFKYFFGSTGTTRGGPYDADLLREGNPKELGALVEMLAARLEERIAGLDFAAFEEGGGRNVPKVTLEGAARSLKAIAADMKKRKDKEHEDYHWEIIGDLVSTVAALLQMLEAK